jgi:pimeloyl-ACP methyl ester carboxylesterase
MFRSGIGPVNLSADVITGERCATHCTPPEKVTLCSKDSSERAHLGVGFTLCWWEGMTGSQPFGRFASAVPAPACFISLMIPHTPAPTILREPVRFRALDGCELSMTRVRRADGASRGAVVLQHGLGSNGMVFDYPGRSLAQELAQAGFDCFVSQLRGANAQPTQPIKPYGLDEYVAYDVPAILETACATGEHARVHWVGHSLGGILLMLHAIEQPDAPIERFVAIGSSLDYRPGRSVYRDLRRLLGLISRGLRAVPFDTFARWNALSAGYGPLLLPEKMNFWRSNVEREIMRGLLQHGFTQIPVRLLLDLDSTFTPRGFSRAAGRIEYLTRASDFRVASCLIVGSRDAQCGEAAVDETARLLSGAPGLRVARFGRTHGHLDDYGHFDLILGKRAEHEVWPTIRNFLS